MIAARAALFGQDTAPAPAESPRYERTLTAGIFKQILADIEAQRKRIPVPLGNAELKQNKKRALRQAAEYQTPAPAAAVCACLHDLEFGAELLLG